jgi:hypothetical protein
MRQSLPQKPKPMVMKRTIVFGLLWKQPLSLGQLQTETLRNKW